MSKNFERVMGPDDDIQPIVDRIKREHRIMAAAPDMYEALKALLYWEKRLPDGDYKRDIEAARAALAKAEGRS